MISIKSKREIELMRQSCQLAALTLDYVSAQAKIGVSTEYLNRLAHEFIISHGAIPSPLNYHGFPKSICTSLNSVICHGIPSEQDVLKDGDLLNIDITTFLNNFHGDTNRTILIGKASEKKIKFVNDVEACMYAGISEIKPGARLGDIGAAIEHMALAFGYGVVHEYCGHGIGRAFHEDPQVLHYGKRGTGMEIHPGMTFTVEPMINMGARHCLLLDDGWTVVTADNSLSAQFEHTILVTDDGHEILTRLN